MRDQKTLRYAFSFSCTGEKWQKNFDLRSSIVLTFSIAAYPMWYWKVFLAPSHFTINWRCLRWRNQSIGITWKKVHLSRNWLKFVKIYIESFLQTIKMTTEQYNNEWMWPGNATFTDYKPIKDVARKRHMTQILACQPKVTVTKYFVFSCLVKH